jgi:hypothetical protein
MHNKIGDCVSQVKSQTSSYSDTIDKLKDTLEKTISNDPIS